MGMFNLFALQALRKAKTLQDVDTEFDERLDGVDTQKINKGEVTVSDIDISKGKFDQTFMSEEFLQQMAGTTPVNAIPSDSTVTLKKLSFHEIGTNLFNPAETVTGKYISGSTGATGTNADSVASGYIKIKPSTTYTLRRARAYAFYDINKAYISGATTSITSLTPLTSPANAIYVRYSWLPVTDNVAVDAMHMNEGNSLMAFESYKEYIPYGYIEQHFDASLIPNNSLPIEKMEFTELGNNIFNKSDIESNKTLTATTGNTADGAGFATSGFIKIESSTPYSIKNVRKCCFYDVNKAFISGESPVSPYNNIVLTSPTNAGYMRIAWYLSNLALDDQMVNVGDQPLPFEPYAYKIKSSVLNIDIPTETAVEMVLPPKIYALVGQELNVYFDNVMSDKDTKYDFDVICSVGQQFETCYRLLPDTAGTYPITIKALKDGVEKAVASSTITVSAVSVGTGVNRKLIVIGDSTTAGGQVISKLLADVATDVMDVTPLGTIGTAPNLQEGRSGWTAHQYVTQATDNAFWNPNTSTFDFAYYMAQQSYTGVDRVIINLGINDMFNHTTDAAVNDAVTTALADYQTMITSIHAYDSNVKVGIAITIPPCYSQDAFAMSYNCGQTRWRYKRNNFLWVKALVNQFKNQEASNIYLVPIDTNLDTRNNFPYSGTAPVNARNTDTVKNFAANAGVHPADSGYWQTADVYWYWLKSFEI